MIIDLLLDRKDGAKYCPEAFYRDIRAYESELDIDYISKALDYGSDRDVHKALCKYLVDFDYIYDPALFEYVTSVPWI